MDKNTFYLNIKSWEKAKKKVATGFFAYMGCIVLVLNFWGHKIQIDTAADFIIVVLVLAVPACILLYMAEKTARKYGLMCKSCNKKFDQYSLLMHIAYTNKCPKCETNIYHV